MKRLKYKYYVCDFETTVFEHQTSTEVWASAAVELFTEDVKIFHSIDEQWNFFCEQKENIIAYYHNLKFDGAFWLSYFMVDKGFKQAYIQSDKENANTIRFIDKKDLKNDTFIYNISELGQWYSITIMHNGKYIELRDSLKLLPFSVKKLGKSFGTKHKKLEMEYEGYRYAGCEITPEERAYIANDVLVVKEALEIMFTQGHNKLTIGACCLSEFKRLTGDKRQYEYLYPDLFKIPLSPDYDAENAGEYIRQSYHGGWCYVAKGKERQIKTNGTTADVNSLYPSMMSSESGNLYPYGMPTFWKGNYIPEEATKGAKFYFVRINTRFYLKKDKLPFIQIKNNLLYKAREMLETSDIKSHQDGKYYKYTIDPYGNKKQAIVTLTLTQMDFALLKEQYNLEDFEILDGCYFEACKGLFDAYIEKYKKIKMESTGAQRELAKLFLNNLYGKMAASEDSSFKIAYVKDDMSIGFITVVAKEKQAGYIAIGSAITSYARNFTITAAQANYHGVNKRGFIYADTDSIHCDLKPEQIKGIKVHDKNFCCWKLESCWDKGIFIRPKTYIEHVTHENLEKIESPYWNVKCAGMPDNCKELFVNSMTGKEITEEEIKKKKWNEEQVNFMKEKRELKDFDIGLVIPGKLRPKRIKGGILLEETTYKMREM